MISIITAPTTSSMVCTIACIMRIGWLIITWITTSSRITPLSNWAWFTSSITAQIIWSTTAFWSTTTWIVIRSNWPASIDTFWCSSVWATRSRTICTICIDSISMSISESIICTTTTSLFRWWICSWRLTPCSITLTCRFYCSRTTSTICRTCRSNWTWSSSRTCWCSTSISYTFIVWHSITIITCNTTTTFTCTITRKMCIIYNHSTTITWTRSCTTPLSYRTWCTATSILIVSCLTTIQFVFIILHTRISALVISPIWWTTSSCWTTI